MRLTFGVSGKLYKSALVLYDRQTQSLWSQLLQQAITGPWTGRRLTMLPAEHTTWEQWRKEHPDTLVLSTDTGFSKNYDRNPYQDYWERGAPLYSSSRPKRTPLHLRPMERVLGVEFSGVHKAYPFSALKKMPSEFEDHVGGKAVWIHFDARTENGYVTEADNQFIPSIVTFWFAWQDFYPETLVFETK